jgi:hypothetical protein
MFLPANPQGAGQPARPGPECRRAVVLPEHIVGQQVMVFFQRLIDRNQWRQRLDLDLGTLHRAAGSLSRVGDDREHHLVAELDDVLRKNRIVAVDGAAVVPARHIGGGDDLHDAFRRTHGIETEPRDAPMRQRRAAGRHVERAF